MSLQSSDKNVGFRYTDHGKLLPGNKRKVANGLSASLAPSQSSGEKIFTR
jgi:hypothetical protein